ncbi:glycosyltransferase family 9 protein [Geomonas agri]|uniref:glycosyltransferase family 9 protein n=1 Tax=Geomonas agri TaxID=2873702 RepID=UPI001CD4F459|nr:glycosyltransferase family 9 protein [Geomonas agri]
MTGGHGSAAAPAPANILIIKPGAIGDLLHMTPVIRALKGIYPHASITIMVSARVTAQLFADNPLVDEVVIFDKKGEQRTWGGVFKLWKRLRPKRFDLVLNYQRSNLKAWALVAAAIPCRVLVYHKTRTRTIHAILDHLRPLKALGIDPETADRTLDFFPSEADHAFAARFIADNVLAGKRIVAFNPGTSSANKCWPIERFAELGDRLVAQHGAAVVVVGSRDEAPLADAIRAGMQREMYDLCGCSLGELAALLGHCELMVTGDTGPMHIAAAVGTPVLALYGPISPVRSAPLGEKHRIVMHDELECCPCNSFKCKIQSFRLCMEMITVDEVARTAAEMLSDNTR